jgi:hypothetical protein
MLSEKAHCLFGGLQVFILSEAMDLRSGWQHR